MGGFDLIDRATQAWVRHTGRRVALDACAWLDGPTGRPGQIATEWLEREAARRGGKLRDGGGLLASFDDLASPNFDPALLHPAVVGFYEDTSAWRMEVWPQWCPAAWPAAWLLSTVFARRLQQLALPLRPLDVAHGVDSRVTTVAGRDGRQLGAAWLRTLRATGQTVYSGWYGIAQLPLAAGPSVRVIFPLPNGSLTVYLRPSVESDGALVLTSPIGDFGDDGAYLIVVEDSNAAVARRVPLVETFRVYVDSEGTLRTDHALDLVSIAVLRLHYRLEHRA